LLLDVWPLQRLTTASARSVLLEKVPFFLLGGISIFATYRAQHLGGAVGAADIYPLADRFANACNAYVLYLAKAFWPARLSAFYPYTSPLKYCPYSATLLTLISTICLVLARRAPYLLMGWLWYLGMLVP